MIDPRIEAMWQEFQRSGGFRVRTEPPLFERDGRLLYLQENLLAEGFFFAEISGRTGSAYSWVERVETSAGVWANGTLSGTLNAYIAEPSTPVGATIATGTLVIMRPSPTVPGVYEIYPPSPGLTVRTVGGTPSYSGITTEEFSSDFTVTNPATGTARVAGNYTKTVSYLDNVCIAVTKNGDGLVTDVVLTKSTRTVTALNGATISSPTCTTAGSTGCCPTVETTCCEDPIPQSLTLSIYNGATLIGSFPFNWAGGSVWGDNFSAGNGYDVPGCGKIKPSINCSGSDATGWPLTLQNNPDPGTIDCVASTCPTGLCPPILPDSGSCSPFSLTYTVTLVTRSGFGPCACDGTTLTFVITE